MQDMDGMKTAQIFREKASDKILIFVSSSREYVFEAYDVEAFQYLLKPVDDRMLKSVLQKAVLKTESRSQEFIIVSREVAENMKQRRVEAGWNILRQI